RAGTRRLAGETARGDRAGQGVAGKRDRPHRIVSGEGSAVAQDDRAADYGRSTMSGWILAPKPTEARGMRIRMTYRETGNVYHWTVRKAQGGWEYVDHEGYSRYAEGNWRDLVERFKLTADNYGMDCNIS